MNRLRRVAVLAMGVALGVGAVALPAQAAQAQAAAPPSAAPAAVANTVTAPKPNDVVPKDKSGRLVLFVDGQQAAQAVAKVGGTVSTSRTGRVEAEVSSDKVAELAKQPGVSDIRRPDRIVPMGSIDPEGLQASGADTWISAGKTGSGVKVGIIDPDFEGLDDSQAAGALPQSVSVNNSTCQAASSSHNHGVAVAEVVHAMAPGAQLFLACAGNSMEFAAAADWLQQQGVKVIAAAIGMFTSGRGDGTGAPGSPADVVRRTSQAGILWSVAAGNQAQLHYSGNATTAADGFVTFAGTSAQNNTVNIPLGGTATFGLRWDAWPTTNQEFDLYLVAGSAPPTGPTDPNVVAMAVNNQATTPGGGEPTAELTFTNPSNSQDERTTYSVYVKNVNGNQSTRLDLFAGGLNDGTLQYHNPDGSITEPATSQYAMAVGASKPGSGQVETTSSQGPTIDGRVKPDITGYDGVSTSYWPNGSFNGTSAAAAHVAGAAALMESANPALDASQTQAALLQLASPKRNNNQWGAGPLTLGPPSTVPTVTGAGYTPLPKPVSLEGRGYAPNEVETLPIPNVPSDTTAVVFNLAVRTNPTAGPNVDTGMDVYTGDPATSSSKATTVRVRPGDGFISTMVVAPVGSDRAIRLKAGTGNVFDNVDMLGYFSKGVGGGYLAQPQPVRILDTRGFNGSPRKTPMGANEVYSIPVRGTAGVPANANAVLVNLTASEASVATGLSLYATDLNGTSMNTGANEKRSNQSIVAIAPDGTIKLHNAAGQVQVSVDVIGSFTTDAGGARFVALPETTRIADTTTGTGQRGTPIGQGEVAGFQVGGLAGVSRTATGAVMMASGEDDSTTTDLSLFPQETGWSKVTNQSLRQRQKLSATAFVPLGASGQVDVRNERGQAQVALDVAGYFVGGPALDPGSADCAAPTGETGFTSLYDGRSESNLLGWRTAGTKPLTDTGCTLTTTTGTDVSWYAAHTLGDSYTVRLDWKANSDTSDSGVMMMFGDPGTDPAAPGNHGVEVQIGATGATGQAATGAVVPFQAPTTTSAAKPTGQWNTYEISVELTTITVKLNGQQVNQYTVTDPARISNNTYLGLQNSGAAGSVAFRNVRVRRDLPMRSGQFVGINNRCLDLLDDNNANTGANGVRMADCTSSASQVWAQTADSELSTATKCLSVASAAVGTPVLLAGCYDGSAAQVWVVKANGTIVNPHSERCLTPASTGALAALQLQDCTGRADQVWRVPNQHAQNGQLTDPGGKCLDVPNGDPRSNAVQVWDCYHNKSQSWTAIGDGSLRVAGKCLTVGTLTAAGSKAALADCAAVNGQGWVLRTDGTVVNPGSGRCLTGASDTSGAAVTIQDCTASAAQQWRMSAQNLWVGALVGIGGKCADIEGEDPSKVTVWLWDCFGSNGEAWQTQGDGALTAMGSCVDIGNVVNGTPVGVTTCSTAASQQWSYRPDGTVVNTDSGRCLDDQSGTLTNGTKMQIWDCVGTPQQRWATPITPG